MALIVSKGKRQKNFSVLLYGTPGIGKTTLANLAESPVIFDCEDGSSEIDCTRVEIDCLETLREAMEKVKTGKSRTVIFDGLTVIEKWLTAEVLVENNVKTLSAIPWGQGGNAMKAKWGQFQESVKELNKYVNTIQIAHERTAKVEDPLSLRTYDRYEPDIHAKALNTVSAAVDYIFFYRLQVTLKNDDKKEAKASTKGRELYTEETPAYLAKTRRNLESCILAPDHTLFERLL